MEEENKNCECKNCNCKKSGSCLTILLLLIIVGLVGFICYDKLINKNNDKDKKSNSNEVSNVESNSTSNTNELTEDVKKSIYNKLVLLFADENKTYGQTLRFIYGHNVNPMFEKTMSDEEKSFLIIRTIDGSKITQKKIKKSDIKTKNLGNIELDNVATYPVISGEDFAKNYKEVFGQEPAFVKINGCPNYFYDLNSKSYLEYDGCGFVTSYEIFAYPTEYKLVNDNIEVTTYVGSISSSPDSHNYYKDINNSDGNDKSTTSKFSTINDSNKDSFTKYIFVFKKASDGNYYFDSVKKA